MPTPSGTSGTWAIEHRLGRLLGVGVIQPRLRQVYDWSAVELGRPGATCWPATCRAMRGLRTIGSRGFRVPRSWCGWPGMQCDPVSSLFLNEDHWATFFHRPMGDMGVGQWRIDAIGPFRSASAGLGWTQVRHDRAGVYAE